MLYANLAQFSSEVRREKEEEEEEEMLIPCTRGCFWESYNVLFPPRMYSLIFKCRV